MDKNIVAIQYNVLNLPDIIQFKNGNQVINTYNGAGQKLRTKYYTAISPVIVPVGTICTGINANDAILRLDDYFGSILYENGTAEDAAHHPLTKVMIPEGYVDYATAGKPYCYYRQDHLGSIREVDSYQGTNRTVVQKTQYYPSGTSFQENYGAGEQPYKFTGKELITMHGLNWQDFGARWLDNVRMQFTSMDPLAEKYFNISPYVYCNNNPLKMIDPDGMDIYILNKNGEYILALKENKDDKLFSMDPNGRLNGKEITIGDKKLLPQLAHGKSAETSNSKDAFNLFKFSADNSDVEWHLKGYDKKNGGMDFLLNTSNSHGSVSDIDGNYDPSNLDFDLHSHPPGTNDQGPSGFISLFSDGKNNYYDADNEKGGSDCQSLLTHMNSNSSSKHYIYHVGSKQLIYYDLDSASGIKTQNKRGVTLGVVKSATLMRSIILH